MHASSRAVRVRQRSRAFQFAPRTWLGWVVTVVVGLILLAVAAVFVTAALIAGLVIAAGLIARAWWLIRKAERAREKEYLSAEYHVEREERHRLADAENAKHRR